MALAYLLDPCLQYQNRAGVNNVSGYLEVFRMDTDDRATVYVDFSGTLAPEHIGIDNDGRAVMIVESGIPYRVEMHGPNGELFWTQQPVWTVASGGGAVGTSIVSTDGSIAIDKSTVGSVTTYDLSSRVEDSIELLGWIRCDGGVQVPETDIWKPTYTAGTLPVGERGIQLSADQYYHATARVRITKGAAAGYYDDMQLVFGLDDGTDITAVATEGIIADSSIGLSQDFEISCDVLAESDCELVLEVQGKEIQSLGIEILGVDVHRVYSGAPYIPGGVADKPWVEENYQEKLVAGDNIVIDGNVISSTGADIYTVERNNSPELLPDTVFDEAYAAYLAGKTLVLKWVEADSRGTCIGYSSAYGLMFAVEMVNLSGAQTDSTAAKDGFIQYFWLYKRGSYTYWGNSLLHHLPRSYAADAGKVLMVDPQNPTSYPIWASLPDLSEYVTDTELETILEGYATTAALQAALAGKQDVISDLSDIRSGAALGATAVQDPDYVHTDNNFTDADATKLSGIQAGAEVNVQANWNESDSSSDSFILNKPTIPVLPEMKELVAGNNITITEGTNDVTISATDTTYSAGYGIEISNGTIVVDTTEVALKGDIPVIGTITL